MSNREGAMQAEDELIGSLSGDLRRIAEVAGLEAAVKIASAFRGTHLYVPGLDEHMRRARDESIRADYDDGVSIRRLSAKYWLTQRGIRKILDRPSKASHPVISRLLEGGGD